MVLDRLFFKAVCVLAIWQRHASMTVGAGERRRAEARESETAR